jgi:hypothetical protein
MKAETLDAEGDAFGKEKRLLSLVIDKKVSMARPVASPESTGGKDNYRLAVLPNLAGKFIHQIPPGAQLNLFQWQRCVIDGRLRFDRAKGGSCR